MAHKTDQTNQSFSDSTMLQHPPALDLSEENRALVSPIYQSVKYYFEKFEDLEKLFTGKRSGYLYSRNANPTVRQLEMTLAQLQGEDEAIALGSGMAAITTTLMTLLKSGDHVVCFYESYRPGRVFIRETLKKFGVTHSIVNIDRPEDFSNAFIPGKTKAVFFESPTNPMLKIAPIRQIVTQARKCDALVILDNTFAGPHQHHGLGVDLFIHSLTKFVVGFGDGMGGAIVGRKDLIEKIRAESVELGSVLDPHVANLCLRGLKTYFLRYNAQAEASMELAKWLKTQEKIRNLFYPGDAQHPHHDLAREQMLSFGSVMAFDVGSSKAHMVRFLDHLKLIKPTGSLGATESLIAPCELFYALDLSEKERAASKISENSLRLSVGLEDISDLKKDIVQALTHV